MSMRSLLVGCLILGCVSLAASVDGQGLPPAAPADVGLSAERLERIGALLQADIDQGRLPGAVVLVARRGKIAYFKNFGMQNPKAGIAMPKDAIFRLYSMSKPIISTAVMILHEEGRLHLTQLVSEHLPVFKEMQVGVVGKDPATGKATLATESATRRMTIQQLLTHTSGLSYGFNAPAPIKTLYKQAKIGSRDQTVADQTQKLGKLPLIRQPETYWQYSRSYDVLGRLIEVVAGMPLDQFLDERLFRPLGMVDTGFYVPQEKLGRLAEQAPLPKGSKKKQRKLLDVTSPPKLLGGGGGLVSTVADYTRFAHMLLHRGTLDGTRILSRKTVEYMTADHLGPLANRTDRRYYPGPGYGYGLGVAVRLTTGQAGWPGTVGDYFWGGAAGTYFWVDPQEELVAVIMYQARAQRSRYRKLFRSLVYQAIVD